MEAVCGRVASKWQYFERVWQWLRDVVDKEATRGVKGEDRRSASATFCAKISAQTHAEGTS